MTSPVDRVVPEGVVTADGGLREADTLILGTGFAATEHHVILPAATSRAPAAVS